MDKRLIVDELSKRNLLSQKQTSKILDDLFDLIYKEVAKGDTVKIKGFGKFSPHLIKPRYVKDLNSTTNEEIRIDAKITIKFTLSNRKKLELRESPYMNEILESLDVKTILDNEEEYYED